MNRRVLNVVAVLVCIWCVIGALSGIMRLDRALELAFVAFAFMVIARQNAVSRKHAEDARARMQQTKKMLRDR